MDQAKSYSLREVILTELAKHQWSYVACQAMASELAVILLQSGLARSQTVVPKTGNDDIDGGLFKIGALINEHGSPEQEMAFLDLAATLKLQQQIVDMPNVKALISNESALVAWEEIYSMRRLDLAVQKVCSEGGATEENLLELKQRLREHNPYFKG